MQENKKSVIFVVSSIKQARCIRRIEDFIKNGYNIKVYGFARSGDIRALPSFDFVSLGEIENGGNFFKRVLRLQRIEKRILKENDPATNIFYLFNFDVAIAFLMNTIFRKVSYMYEVPDLQELSIHNKIIRWCVAFVNKKVIMGAYENVFTSEGFAEYYFGDNVPDNITVLPNKLHTSVRSLEFPHERNINMSLLKINFTGVIRFKSILNFIEVVSESFPNIEVHFHGLYSEQDSSYLETKKIVENSSNIFFHGPFKNPVDLPSIYAESDLVLALYPPTPSVVYAEPNKLYEAIYYEKPIIVSNGTFLGRKVKRLNVGFSIDAMNKKAIKSFLEGLSLEQIENRIRSCKMIPKDASIDDSSVLFKKLESL